MPMRSEWTATGEAGRPKDKILSVPALLTGTMVKAATANSTAQVGRAPTDNAL